MTCAKKRVIAKLTTKDGKVYYGENSCNNPQKTCPRVGDKYKHEDYKLCFKVCGQLKHAEQDAFSKANKACSNIEGAKMEINHRRTCVACTKLIEHYKITDITLNAEIKRCLK